MGFLVNEGFVSHAGLKLLFKIECDALDDEDIKTIAAIIARTHSIQSVHGIPRGGFRLAKALEKYVRKDGKIDLIVDDVLTTGTSMEEKRKEVGPDAVGVVIFARAPCPDWIKPFFQLSEWAGP